MKRNQLNSSTSSLSIKLYKLLSLLLSVTVLLSISGCAKDPIPDIDDEDSQDGKYLISFTIDGFSQDLLPFSDKIRASDLSASANRNLNSALLPNSIQATGEPDTDIRDIINTLEIKVYRGNFLVDSVRQYADDPNFGKFANYYNPGTPHNLFVAGALLENEGDLIMKKDSPTGTTRDVYLRVLPQATDAFFIYKAYDFSKEPQHENLKLKRFVGRVEVELDEIITSDANRIDITIENTAAYFLPYHQRGYHLNQDIELDQISHHTIKSVQIKPEDVGRTDFSLSAYFVLKSELGTAPETTKIILAAYREDGSMIRQKEIPNVSLQANKRTKLVGKLFTVPNVDFEVGLESDWHSEVPEYEF